MARLALEASGLRKSYSGREVLSLERLEAQEGEVFAILGPNASGKSTLFRILSLVESPDQGEVRYFGRVVGPGDVQARRMIASVFQRPLLFQGTVIRNVAYGMRLRGTRKSEAKHKAEGALQLVKAAHLAGRDVRNLSGGELQRVALARALALEPAILFLDEPTSNLDANVRRQFREELRQIVKGLSSTVILITHDQKEAFSLASRVGVMQEGRLVQVGSADEVLQRPGNEFVADFVGTETSWLGEVVESADGLCLIRTPSGTEAVVAAHARPGESITVTMEPDEVVLSREPSPEAHADAWNQWPVIVESLTLVGSLVRVKLRVVSASGEQSRDTVHALISTATAESLALVPGSRAVAAVKAASLYRLESAARS